MTFNLRVPTMILGTESTYYDSGSSLYLFDFSTIYFLDFCVVYKERKVNYLRYEESFVHNKIPRFVLFLISPAHKWNTQSIPFILNVLAHLSIYNNKNECNDICLFVFGYVAGVSRVV
uniref:Uncharacterized protein n=1 Tax=Cacopsylla melanoneura TaxID=428564 RepID=A0A8D8PLN7_9HEMI